MNQNVIYEILHDKIQVVPNNIAVFNNKRTLTRIKLKQLINTIAVKILAEAHRVGIMMEHTVEMIATIFAVLKTGKAYVPIEPFFPQKRIEFMMNDSNVDIIITNSTYKEKETKFPYVLNDPGMEAEDVVAVSSALPDDPAYILYTFGSMSMPKGVDVCNRIGNTVVRWLLDYAKRQGITKIYLETSDCGRALYEGIGFRDMQDYMKL